MGKDFSDFFPPALGTVPAIIQTPDLSGTWPLQMKDELLPVT
jgi:hypothetical protein